MVLGSSQSSAKELTTQSSIFRFLVLLLCFTSATGGQINGKLLNGNGVFVSRDELQNKNVRFFVNSFIQNLIYLWSKVLTSLTQKLNAVQI